MHIIETTVIKSCAHQKNLRTTPVFAEKNESIQCRLESGTSILLSELIAISLQIYRLEFDLALGTYMY